MCCVVVVVDVVVVVVVVVDVDAVVVVNFDDVVSFSMLTTAFPAESLLIAMT